MTTILEGLRAKYSVGDEIWVYTSCGGYKLYGQILEVVDRHRFGYCYEHYICEMQSPVDSYLDFFTPFQLHKVAHNESID